MTEAAAAPGERHYFAFLSYAHTDRETGGWLHRALENYRTPKKLRAARALPERLFPIFRDREELSAGGDLPQRIEAALRASDFLIVLCSPAAKASRWVNAEIATFKKLGKGNCIIPVIAEGDPESSFPFALGRKVDASGALTEEHDPAEHLGADLRASGDGRRDAVLKIAAGLLDVPLGELRQRDAEAARARARFAYALAGVFLLLSIGAAASAYIAIDSTKRIRTALVGVLDRVSKRVDETVEATQRGDIRAAEANRLLALADDLIATAFDLAPNDPRLKLEEARLRDEFTVSHLALGDYDKALEQAERAIANLRALKSRDPAGERQHVLAIALLDRGDAQMELGRYDLARADYTEALALARELAAEQDDANAWGKVSSALDKFGLLAIKEDDTAAARASYEEMLGIERKLAARAPQDIERLRGVGVAAERGGSVAIKEGRIAEARALYGENATIMRELLESDPENAANQANLAAALGHVSDAALAEGALDAARGANEESLSLYRALAEADPTNRPRQGDLAIALKRKGDIAARAEAFDETHEAFAESLAIWDRLTQGEAAGDNAWRGYIFALMAKGDAGLAEGDLTIMREGFESAITHLRERLKIEPENIDYLDALALSLDRMMSIEMAEERGDAARSLAEENVSLHRAMLARKPEDVRTRRGLALTLMRIGDLARAEERYEDALGSYGEALALHEALHAKEPENDQLERDLWVANARLASIAEDAAPYLRAALELMSEMRARGVLGEPEIAFMGELEAHLAEVEATASASASPQ